MIEDILFYFIVSIPVIFVCLLIIFNRPKKKVKPTTTITAEWLERMSEGTRDLEDIPPAGRPSGKLIREIWFYEKDKNENRK